MTQKKKIISKDSTNEESTKKSILDLVDNVTSKSNKVIESGESFVETFDKGKELFQKIWIRVKDVQTDIDKRNAEKRIEQEKLEKRKRREVVYRKNESICKQLEALEKFHLSYRACTIEQYIKSVISSSKKPRLEEYYNRYGVKKSNDNKLRVQKILKAKAEQEYEIAYRRYNNSADVKREDIYNNLMSGGDWFKRYIDFNIKQNKRKTIDDCGISLKVKHVLHSISKYEWGIKVIFPLYKDFEPIKEIQYDENNDKEILIPVSENEKEELYTKLIYSYMLQVIGTVFDCANHAANCGSDDYLAKKVSVCGVKYLINRQNGGEHECSIITIEVTEEQYRIMDVNNVLLRDLIEWLKPKINGRSFFDDEYEPTPDYEK